MSGSDSDRDRRGDNGSNDRDRSIAIPGYRRSDGDGPRHRPPSVTRTRTGRGAAQRGGNTRPSTTGRDVRAGAGRRSRETSSGSTARPQRAAPTGPRSRSGGSSRTPSRPTTGAQRGGRTRSEAAGRPEDSVVAAASGPRGVEALQAEVARGDVRLLANQIAAEPTGFKSEAVRSSQIEAPDAPPRWLGWRVPIAMALVVFAVLFTGLPVMQEANHRQRQVDLAAAIQTAAAQVGQAPEAQELPGWIRARELGELRAFFTQQRPLVAKSIVAAGFEGVSESDIGIRVDFRGETLIINARIEDGESSVLVAADLDGTLIGRAPPPEGVGPVLSERRSMVVATFALLVAIVGLMWALPLVAQRRRR